MLLISFMYVNAAATPKFPSLGLIKYIYLSINLSIYLSERANSWSEVLVLELEYFYLYTINTGTASVKLENETKYNHIYISLMTQYNHSVQILCNRLKYCITITKATKVTNALAWI